MSRKVKKMLITGGVLMEPMLYEGYDVSDPNNIVPLETGVEE